MSDDVAAVVSGAAKVASKLKPADQAKAPPVTAKKEPLSLDERIAWMRCLSALSQAEGRDVDEWQAEAEAVLAADEVFAPLRGRLAALNDPVAGQEARPSPLIISQRLRGIILAAMRMIEARPITSISDAISREIKQKVDDYAWKSEPIRLFRWLLPLMSVAILGGTAFGVYKYKGVLDTLESAKEEAEKKIGELVGQVKTDAATADLELDRLQSLATKADGLKSRIETAEGRIGGVTDQVGTISDTVTTLASRIDGATHRMDEVATELHAAEAATGQLKGFTQTAAVLGAQPPAERSQIVAAALVLAPFLSPLIYVVCGVSVVSLVLALWVLVLALRALRKARSVELLVQARA